MLTEYIPKNFYTEGTVYTLQLEFVLAQVLFNNFPLTEMLSVQNEHKTYIMPELRYNAFEEM